MEGLFPELVLSKVFSYLNWRDLTVSCIVCKKWNLMARLDPRLASLVMLRRPIGVMNKRWFYSNRPIDASLSMSWLDLDLEKFERNQLFSNVKRLLFVADRDAQKNARKFIVLINSLQTLEQLELEYFLVFRDNFPQKFTIKLPILKSFSTGYLVDDFGVEVVLDTPMLSAIKSSHSRFEKMFRLKYPEKIKYADLKSSETFLEKFPNLEVVKLRILIWAPAGFFGKLSKLKEFHFKSKIDVCLACIAQKKELGRDDLKLFFMGVNCDDPDRLNQLRRNKIRLDNQLLNEANIALYLDKHLELAEKFDFFTQINYNAYEGYHDQFPANFLERFTEVYKIKVTRKIKSEAIFTEFIRRIEPFDKLTLAHCGLNQTFHSTVLADLCPLLKVLHIYNYYQIQQLDLAFIFDLKHLVDFRINWQIDLGPMKRAFDELEYFTKFKFIYRDKKFKIQKFIDSPNYRISNSLGYGHDLDSFEQICEYLKNENYRSIYYWDESEYSCDSFREEDHEASGFDRFVNVSSIYHSKRL